MKLILSSRDFHEEAPAAAIYANLPKPAAECRILFLPNDRAEHDDIHCPKFHRRLKQKGFSKENIFVFDHEDPAPFFGMDLDVIYMSGGNTFRLMERLRASGFDRELARYLRAGVTYIGGSAGAHIVSADISHIVRYDEVPEGFSDFRGLGLYPGIFVCHFSEERRAHFEELQKTSPYPVRALTNDDTFVYET